MGNLRSVQKAFEKVGASATISNNHEIIKNADKLVLPGVGSFKDGMKHLHELGLINILQEEVLQKKKPFLGICLGMQLIASRGYENGETKGLNWIDAEVVKFNFTKSSQQLKVPHVGWNELQFNNSNTLFQNIKEFSDFYFVHSYYFKTKENIVTSYTNYGIQFTSSIQKDNIFAFQFHPEKSQEVGLKIIKNFVNKEFLQC